MANFQNSLFLTTLCEHKRAVTNKNEFSELAKHVFRCIDCSIHWEETKVLDREQDCYKRLIKESLRIISNDGCFSNVSVALSDPLQMFLNS